MTLSAVRPQNRLRASSHATAIAGIALASVATMATFRLSQTIACSSALQPLTSVAPRPGEALPLERRPRGVRPQKVQDLDCGGRCNPRQRSRINDRLVRGLWKRVDDDDAAVGGCICSVHDAQ